MADQRRGGTISLNLNGELQDAKGAFTYNLGKPKREGIIGADGVHGYKEVAQQAFIEGAITDRSTLDLKALVTMKDGVATLELANGKVVVLRDAYWAGEGTVNTEEGEIAARWEGSGAEEIS
jgi:hypothetical protein